MSKPLTVFMLLKALPAWLALSRRERAGIADGAFKAALVGDRVRLRYFDAEAFAGRTSDVAMFEADSIEAHHFAVERLRDSPIFAHPYFEVVDVIPAIEEGFRDFEAATGRM